MSGIAGIFKSLANPLLLLPLLGMLGWIALEIWVGEKVALWNTGLVSNTVVWTVGTALVLYFNVNKAAEDPLFFRKTAKSALAASVLVEFFINLFVFGLLAELLLQFVLIVLVMVDAFSGQKSEFQQGKKFWTPCSSESPFCCLATPSSSSIRNGRNWIGRRSS